MTELDWDKILDHLKYEEKLVLEIMNNKKKYKSPQHTSLDPDDISRLRKIDRDARRRIYRRLHSKKHILSHALLHIEAADSWLMSERGYDNGKLGSLLLQIQEAIKLVKRQKEDKGIYQVFELRFTQHSIEYGGSGFQMTEYHPKHVYPNRNRTLACVERNEKLMRYGPGVPKYIEINCATTDNDNKWFKAFIKECEINKLLIPVYRGHFFDSALDEAFNTAFELIKEKLKSDKDIVMIRKIGKRFIYIERDVNREFTHKVH